ncbi:hypothetical protein [Streptomyces jumonjinensis]|uniref:hypothetical protein n=1 Tax=Streptomyces jumonjinensis TaxID=1945 RepID=UPI0037AFC126
MTPAEFRAAHGDPQSWCGAEVDEYLVACDGIGAIRARLERTAAYIDAHPGATSAEILAVFKGGAL